MFFLQSKSQPLNGLNPLFAAPVLNFGVGFLFARYLYVCASTVCVYIGVFVVAATTIYTHLVLLLRKRMQVSAVSNAKR